MATGVKELSDQSFGAEIASGVTLVDFWAPWCAPCRMQTPILAQVAARVGETAKIAKVNVDECPQVADRLGIRSIPTLIIFKDGQPVQQLVGVQPEELLVTAIQEAAT